YCGFIDSIPGRPPTPIELAITFEPTVLIAHIILGPVGWKIGTVIANVVYSSLTSTFGWLFAAVFGFTYAPLVITGLHHMTNAIDLQIMPELGGTNLWPMIALSNIAQGSAVFSNDLFNKNNEEKNRYLFQQQSPVI
ncbi:PTS system trehalose(maltose)-specific transporter subunits IIBC, partial [Clostridium botulinum Af84]